MNYLEIKKRNYYGRVFNLTQENVKQLQDDIDHLLAVLSSSELLEDVFTHYENVKKQKHQEMILNEEYKKAGQKREALNAERLAAYNLRKCLKETTGSLNEKIKAYDKAKEKADKIYGSLTPTKS